MQVDFFLPLALGLTFSVLALVGLGELFKELMAATSSKAS
tara:strand:- start:190 stop:309 length:120 start_codon:yes stop_codon:yes gene_type:complete